MIYNHTHFPFIRRIPKAYKNIIRNLQMGKLKLREVKTFLTSQRVSD